MISYLADYEHIWGPLRLFKYITVRGVMAIGFAMLVGFVLAPALFRKLRSLRMAEKIRDTQGFAEIAEKHLSHKFEGKKNTPTMGGLLIYISVTLTTLIFANWNSYVLVALLIYTVLTGLGFWDDYMKVAKKNKAGLSGVAKMVIQAVLTFVVLVIFLYNSETHQLMSQLWVPFYKQPVIEFMPTWFMFLFLFLVIAGSSNAVNLTDGIDGLAIGCTITVAMTYAIMAYVAGNSIIAGYLFIEHIPGTGELAVLCSALVGASLVFLWYNAHPAEVFMGDTGSLGLGGLIGGIAFMVHEPFTLIIIGGIFVMEAGSVILQVGSNKLIKKRPFKMAPIHHHFELKNWHENKVVIRFWILSLLFGLAGLGTLKLR